MPVGAGHLPQRLRTQSRYYSGSERERAQLPAEAEHRSRKPGKSIDDSSQRTSSSVFGDVRERVRAVTRSEIKPERFGTACAFPRTRYSRGHDDPGRCVRRWRAR